MKWLGISAVLVMGLPLSITSCTGSAGSPPAAPSLTQHSLRQPSAAPPTGMSHVITGDYLTESNELSNLPLMAKYLTYAFVGVQYLGPLQKLGVRTIFHTNPLQPICATFNSSGSCTWGDYFGYNYLRPGGKYNSVASRDCSGNVIYGSYRNHPALQENRNALNATAYTQATEAAWANWVATNNPGYPKAASVFFIDNASPFIYGTSLTQCGIDKTKWYAQNAKILGGTKEGPYMINGLTGDAVSVVQTQLQGLNAPNITMGEAEQCFGGHYWNSAYPGNYVADTTKFHTWFANEYAEIHTIAMGKIFWCLNRLQGDGSSYPAWRLYTYASFLLGYSPTKAGYEVTLNTPSNLKVYPEMMLVPQQPTVTASDVSGYRQTSGVYLRKFGACYYRGAFQNSCAVAVNPNPSASVPTPSGYKHHVVLSGAGVLDHGTLTITTGVPLTMAPDTAQILFP
jgi:hypothetical protein